MKNILGLLSCLIISSSSQAATRGPNFLIIGAQKSGTSSLYHYLTQHPLISSASSKELHFFDTVNATKKEIDWYRSQFPLVRQGHLTGEATPEYLLLEGVAEKVYKFFPKVKIIVILRDPVSRAFANYKMAVAKKMESEKFEKALALESRRVAVNPKRGAYLTRGKYAEQLERWYKVFPDDQILVLFFEEFFANPKKELNKVFDFLGVRHHTLAKYGNKNASRLPDLVMENATKKRLKNFYKPLNKKLSKLLNRKLPW